MNESLPGHAEIVVIGGGVVGCSVAYHLTGLGRRDVVLLERDRLTCGTTWHSAGNVLRLDPSPVVMKLFADSAALYAGIEAETGQAVGWRNCGRVMPVRSPARLEAFREIAAAARKLGNEVEILTPREVGERLPILRTDDLAGGVWSPGDGRVNPTDLTMAYAKGARARGARLMEGVRVTGIGTRGDEVTGVVTDAGEIACEVAVNCAGMWAGLIGAMCGVSLPLYATEDMYVLTEPIDGVTPDMPTFRDPDGLFYGREETGGLLIGCNPVEPKIVLIDRLPQDFSFALFDEDWDHFEAFMAAAIHRIPALENAGVREFVNGPETETADGRMIMGEAPGLRGFFVLAAMSSVGITASGGAGRALAEWIVTGAPTIDVTELDLQRFAKSRDNRT